jgi:predicted phage tail protein
MTALVPVVAAPVFDPDQTCRIELNMPAGLTVTQIVERACPGLAAEFWDELRVVLVTPKGEMAIKCEYWHVVRPNAGVRTIIRLRPAGSNKTLASVLIAVVSVAAMALGAFVAPLIIPATGFAQTLVQGLITTGLTLAGSLLIRALIPPTGMENRSQERRENYSISGWRNEARPGEPIPVPFGKIRMAPLFAAGSYTEIVGDTQYVRALFTFGPGRLKISDIRIGDTPVGNYKDVTTEVREGQASDTRVTLVSQQVLEEPIGAELRRGIENGDFVATIRTTATDVTKASIILSFSAGLFQVDDEGEITSYAVNLLLYTRPVGSSDWGDPENLFYYGEKREAFYRQHTWTFPSRGQWELKIVRITQNDEDYDARVSSRVHLVAIQSIRPEYPINYDKPLSLLAMRVKATHQLAGSLDTVNALVERYVPSWNGSAWFTGLSRRPTGPFRTLLQSDMNPFPVPDGELDLDALAEWHEYCISKDLKFDGIIQNGETLGEALRMVAGAGRASPTHDGVAWSVIVDRPTNLSVAEISPRNSANFSWQRSYFDPPEGFRIPFLDETNDYLPAERVVPWPTHEGDVTLTEVLEMPGKTDPDEIWIEARRRMYELIHRPDELIVTQDSQARPATRGDQIMASFPLIRQTHTAARVKAVEGALLLLDDMVTMTAGTDYGIRFRTFGEDDSIGTSVVRQVATEPGTADAVTILEPDALPPIGSLVHFGPLGNESFTLRVKQPEPGEGGTTILRMVEAAPVIDTLTDAEAPPAWNGRVGSEAPSTPLEPEPPTFVAVEHGFEGTGDPDGLVVLFEPGTSPVPVSSVRIEHRLSGIGSYDGTTVPVGTGGAQIADYEAGDAVDLRLVAIASDATESDPSAVQTVTIGSNDLPLPTAMDEASIMVDGDLGHARISFASGTDPALARVQVYRVPSGDTFDAELHAVGAPVAVTAGTTIEYVNGDGTRANLLTDPGFDDAPSWTADAGWAVSGGQGTHTPGTADAIKQPLTTEAGATYRGAVDLANATAGSVTPTLSGGTAQTDAAISANGRAAVEVTAVSGNDHFGFDATSDFDGALDNAVLFRVTPSCVPPGTYSYYLEPQNEQGGAGPLTSAFVATIT